MNAHSPLLRGRSAVQIPGAASADPDVSVLIALASIRGARSIAIGSGRDPGVRESVQKLAAEWEAVGGEIALRLAWPETAASWRRQAMQFATAGADLWVMLGPPLGWVQMTRRLLWSTPWTPMRSLLSGDISDPRTLALVGLDDLEGIAGVTRGGKPWHLAADNRIIIEKET